MQRLSVSGEADWGGQNQHSGSAERPKRAALPPPKSPGHLPLPQRGGRVRLSGKGEAQNGNSGRNRKARINSRISRDCIQTIDDRESTRLVTQR